MIIRQLPHGESSLIKTQTNYSRWEMGVGWGVGTNLPRIPVENLVIVENSAGENQIQVAQLKKKQNKLRYR